MTWWDDAACRGMDPELFYPERGEDDKIRAAKAVCATCPVTAQCIDWALVNENFGVWGGTTIIERRTTRRRNSFIRTERPTYIGHSTTAMKRH